jgi:exonuclease III
MNNINTNINQTNQIKKQKIKSFTIHSWNCQGSPSNKITQIRNHLHQFKPQILCLQETRIKQKQNLSSYNIQNYSFTATPHSSGAGGLGMYIRDDVHYKHRADLMNEIVIKNCEYANNTMWHELLINNEIILLANVYINPSNSNTDTSNIIKMISTIKTQQHPFILIGDMNAKHSTWNNFTLTNNIGEQINKFINKNSYTLLNNEYCPFQSTMLFTGSTIDLAISSEQYIINNMKTITDSMFSDHYPIEINIPLNMDMTMPNEKSSPHLTWDTHPKIETTDPQKIKEAMDEKWKPFTELLSHSLLELLNELENNYSSIIQQHKNLLQTNIQTPIQITQEKINEIWNEIKQIIISTSKTTIGEKKIDNKYKHWFTNDKIQEKLKSLRHAKNKYFANRTDENKKHLYQMKQEWFETERQIRNENFQSFCSTLSNNNKIYLNTWMRNKPNTFTPLTNICNLQTNQLPKTTKESLDNLAQYFASVSTSSDENKLSDTAQTIVDEFHQQPIQTSSIIEDENIISYDIIEKCCTTIPTDTAMVTDYLSPYHLKYGGPILYKSLFIFFNLCFISGKLPSDWTSANIFSLHKSGAKDIPSNFRPISLTSIVIRLYERILLPKIMEIIDRSKQLSKYQFGFRKMRSTCDNLYITISHIYKAINCQTKQKNFKNNKLPITFLDLQKAFDKININATLYKLSLFGIKGRMYLFFKSFLTNRKIRTMYLNTFSDWFIIDPGTPQGSCLGPIIFLIYLNDLLVDIENTGKMIPSAFADDISLIPICYNKPNYEFSHLINDMQQSLDICTDWANKWGMKFSNEKSNIVIYRKTKKLDDQQKQLINTLKLSNKQVIMKTTYKYLGVDLHELTGTLFIHHAERILDKAGQVSNLVNRLLQNDISINIGRILSNATVRAVESYALPLTRFKNKLIHKQYESKIAAPLKRVLGYPRHASNAAALFETTIPTINIMREYLLLMVANRYSLLPSEHTAKIEFYKDYYQQTIIKQKYKYRIPKYHYRSIGYEVAQLENQHLTTITYTENKNNHTNNWSPINHITTNKKQLYEKMKQICEQQWNNNETKCQKLRNIKKKYQQEIYQLIDTPQTSKIRARLRADYATNNQSLFKRKLIKDEYCTNIHCKNISETRYHLLLDCPSYNNERNILIKQLSKHNILLTYELLLGIQIENNLLSNSEFKNTLHYTAQFLNKIQIIRKF